MRTNSNNFLGTCLQVLAFIVSMSGVSGIAQTTNPQAPAEGASCTVSAANRNAPVAPGGSYSISAVPGTLGVIRARATCSDGTVGQTKFVFPAPNDEFAITGDIQWGKLDPAPTALGLSSATKRVTTGQTAQLLVKATSIDALVRDVTNRTEGTVYAVSNPLLASVSENGLLTVLPLFASGSSARVVATAINEGGVAGSYMFVLGPRGVLRGRVMRADGVTPVIGAQISIVRTQPMEQVGAVVSDSRGNYELTDVSAGRFALAVTDPTTGDRGNAFSKIENEGEVGNVDVKLNGQGTVVITVINGGNAPVANAEVTLASLGAFIDTRTINTDSSGKFIFTGVPAGDVTVSTRDRPSGLVGAILGLLPVGGTLNLTLKLQPVGSISGAVFGVDGSTLQEGVQVRIISRERGIVSQTVTGLDGAFSFNSLPLSDGPFTLDAFANGRLRSRVPGLVLSNANQLITQNMQFVASGIVTGVVSDSAGALYASATLNLQMTEGARYAFTAKADAMGKFYFGGIPVGNFTITAAKDGRNGLALGRVSTDNESVTTNVQIVTNSLIGKVFQRDGITAAVGVTVYLVPSLSRLSLSINPLASGVLSTTTDAQGKFGFPIPGTDAYTLQAESGLDRGRTQAIITTIDPLRPVEVNVTFLPKGTVLGTVKDTADKLQAGAKVDVTVTGAFTNTWSVTSDANGSFVVPGVFVGDVVAVARNTITRLVGSATGRLLSEGSSININITLAATGSVSGKVLKRDGSIVATPTKVELISNYSSISSVQLENGSSYQFDLVPVGDFSVIATELSTGDKGVATSTINAASEAKSLIVRMVGQGVVRVKVVDESNLPVQDATITLSTTSPFSTSATVKSNSSGEAVIPKVFAGDFSIGASKKAIIGTRSGSANGTLLADQEQSISITLTNRPLGTIKGVLFGSDGITPRAGMLIRMTPEPSLDAYRVTTDSQGRFEFMNVEGGSIYTVNARLFDNGGCQVDRIRAQVAGLTITQQDQTVVRNLQMIGAGRVSGKITNTGGVGVGGIRVRIVNPDPVYGLNRGCAGTFFETFSAADGSYVYDDIPSGNFTISAENTARTLRAEGNGRVRFDTDIVKVDMTLVDSAVSMPYTLHDANAMAFDIAGDGSVNQGKNGVFGGAGTARRGMRLDVIVNGVPVPFSNGDGSIGRLGQNGREIQVDEDNAASKLKISRKIFVPRTGYFARYLEVLENKTADPITVGLKVTSHHSQSNSNPRVVDSSDGDQILAVGAASRDRWVVVDDQEDADPFVTSSIPATGHLFDGVGALKQVENANYELLGSTGKLTWQWDNITIPPGKSVTVMHFAFNQINRYDARQAALRLAQLPPEALEALNTDERDAIINFKTPAEGVNTLEQLPTIDAGIVQGKVLSADGITPISNSLVHLKSKLALYAKDFYTTTDADGSFEFRARADGTASALPVPLYAFDLDATHPKTKANSSYSSTDFVAPATVVTKNIIFNGTGNLRGLVKRHSGGLVESTLIKLCSDDYIFCIAKNSDVSKSDGSYFLSGSLPANYFVFAEKAHPQGGEPIRGQATTTITSGNTSIVDITMENTGTVTGLVRTANGVPVENAEVKIFFGGTGPSRSTQTDTAGRYRFVDIRVGLIRVDARDSVTGAIASASGEVSVDQEVVKDITLKGFGTINVQVNFARGTPTPDAFFSYSGETYGAKTADAAGKANLNVAVGNYTFVASHPDDYGSSYLSGSANATLAQSGDNVNVLITLGAAGAVKGTILRPDGSTLAGGFPYTLKFINGAKAVEVRSDRTSPTGQYRSAGLRLGLYLLTAYDSDQNRFADAEFSVTADGQEVPLDLVVRDNRIALPADLLDANRFRFDVQPSGHLASGHYWAFDQGGSKLTVNGQEYAGASNALLEAGKRQFSISQDQAIDGLKVTRKIFVPRGSYFARYLEIFENPTASPILLDAKVTSNYADARVIDSSSRDTALTTADKWVVLDDSANADPFLVSGQQPATAHVFADAGAGKKIDQADFTITAGTKRTLTQRWNNLAVPAGGKVVVMHFVVQQVNQAGAKASAERLSQLPPEAIQSLTQSELQAIVNFTVPQDGVGTVESLPVLTSSISGRVFEGDATTAVANVRVTVQSTHPLFNRVWGMDKDPTPYCTMAGTAVTSLRSTAAVPNVTVAGNYSVTGRLTDADSIVLPEGTEVRLVAQESQGCFSAFAGHSWSHIPSRQYLKSASTTQDLLFNSGVLTGTISGYPDLQTTTGRMYLSTDDPDPFAFQYIQLSPDGSYTYPGLLPGTYDVLADVPHPQGSGLRGSRSGVTVTMGNTTVIDVQLQPAGSIQGAIITSNGEASVNALIELTSAANEQTYDQCATGCIAATLNKHKGKKSVARTTRTDSFGRYSFAAVPVGAYAVTVTDPISAGKTQASLTVADGQNTLKNITQLAIGSVQLVVKLGSGLPAVDALVYIYADARGTEQVAGRTSSQGLLTVANIPRGNYTIRVRDPRFINDTSFERLLTGSITTNGEVQQQSIVLRTVANVKITAVNADAANSPIAGAQIYVSDTSTTDSYRGATNASGQLTVSGFLEGSYQVYLRTASGGRFGASVQINAIDDAKTIEKTISVTQKFDELGTITFEGERQIYTIAASSGYSLNAIAYGDAGVDQTALPVTRITVYDPAKLLLASGYSYVGQSSNAYNTSGDLANIPATNAGNYTVAVESYAQSGTASIGSYRIITLANGQQVDIVPYADGGTVQGVVFKSDGVTPFANQVISIKTLDALALNTRTKTNANGEYRFTGVPLSDLKLAVLDGSEIATATATLASASSPLTQNMTVKASAPITLEIQNSAGVPYSAGLPITVTDQNGKRDFVTDTNGKVAFDGYGLVTIVAIDPNGSGIGYTTIQAVVGQSFNLLIKTMPTSISGRLSYTDNSPAKLVTLTLTTDTPVVRTYTATASITGEYTFSGLASTGSASIKAQNIFLGLSSTRSVVIPITGGVITSQDLMLRGSGTIKGVIKDRAGQSVAFTLVTMRWTDPNPCDGCAAEVNNGFYTDSTGSFSTTTSINGVPGGTAPIGIPLTFKACGTVDISACVSQTITLVSQDQLLDLGTLVVVGTSIEFTVATPISAAPTINTILVGKLSPNESCNTGQVYGSVQKGGLETLAVGSADVTDIVGFIACQNGVIVAESNTRPISGQANVVQLKTTGLTVSLTDALGQVPPFATALYVRGANENGNNTQYLGSIQRGSTEILLVDAIALGTNPYELVTKIDGQVATTQAVTTQPGQMNLAQIKFSVIKGRAKFRDGTPVNDAYAYAYIVENSMTAAQTGAFVRGVDPGSFEIYGATPGDLELFVQDPESGINATKRVQLVNIATPLSAGDIVMPPTGTVTGILTAANGVVIADAIIVLNGPNISRQASTDASGRYTFERVALSDFVVEVSPGSEGGGLDGFGSASGSVNAENQVVEVPISLLATASISARALDGVTGLANAVVQLEGVKVRQFGMRSFTTNADATGMFTASAQPERLRVIVSDPDYCCTTDTRPANRLGIAMVNLTSSGIANLDIPIGNAVGFTYDFNTNKNYFSLRGVVGGNFDGFNPENYKNDCFGTVSDVLAGSITEGSLPCSYAASINADRDELTFGPFQFGNIEYSRRVYVPLTGTSYARVLDTFKNIGTQNQTTDYSLQNYSLANGAIDSQAIQVLTRNGSSHAYLQMIKHGVGKPISYTANSLKALTIPVGGSKSVMSYLVARPTCNTNYDPNSTCTIAEAGELANAIYNGTQPGMFKGITTSDRASLINFNVPN
jgi:hypothetical protein